MFLYLLRRLYEKSYVLALLSTASILCLVLLLLWFVGDARFIPSLGNPRLWVATGILFLSVCGLYFVFRPSFLRKYLGLSLVLPLIWFATFTWAYGYLYLPESNHLGDYYGISFLLFTLPYIFFMRGNGSLNYFLLSFLFWKGYLLLSWSSFPWCISGIM